MMMKPWREIAVPHEDVLKGTFQQAEFAADLSRVHDGRAAAEYQDANLFFQRTFITEGMRLLLDSVVRRIAGKGGDPVIQLQTAFGGGKTHTMLAVYHMAKGDKPVSQLMGLSPILDHAKIIDLPKANIAVLDGNKLAPNVPKKHGSITARTMWGELAWQLGKEAGYEIVKEADLSGTSPGKELLANLLTQFGPCVILMDELVAYIRQFEEGKSVAGGTYDSNLSFVQALTEAVTAVPNAVLLASLPEADKEAGSQRGINALRALEHYFARVQAIWKPVATEEAFEIVRRRLFTQISDQQAATNVCRAYADFYASNGDDFPQETQDSRYFERLCQAYPIHPEVFDRLYEDWSTLDNFQRTRGVLKLMAKVIHRLWKEGNADPLIMPGTLPLYDADVRNEAIYYLPQGWDPVLERDIDGERAETTEIENKDTLLGSVQACRRAARSVFLGSAPSTANQMVRGLEMERVMLGCVVPGQTPARYKDALKRLTERLHYLNNADSRFWFDTRPNLRKEMEDRKRRFQDKEDVFPVIKDRLQKSMGTGSFNATHIFTQSSDIPDDMALRLVVLPPDAAYSRTGQSISIERATEILKTRGDQPRQKQNRLIFLAADYDCVSRLKDQVRSVLAWQSIVEDYRDNKIVIDNLMANAARASLEQAQEALRRMIKEAYKWVLTPMQEARNGRGISDLQWENFQLNASAPNLSQEIERVLKENELLISEWAPVHLSNLLKNWFWKDDVKEVCAVDVWQKTCCYLYLPRIKDEQVFRNSIAAGTGSQDFFGVAYAKEGDNYVGFSFGRATTPILDGALLLIEPVRSSAFAQAQRIQEQLSAQNASMPENGGRSTGFAEPDHTNATSSDNDANTAPTRQNKVRFYGTTNLDPIMAKKQFADIVDEVLLQFTQRTGVNVEIAIEIRAENASGFDDGIQRAVKENCNVLRFKNAEFE
ncbi:MAG: DUF499 domain-containing protein [Alphaproteobacteria bacterium]|nr:DUF499 domain-containing protein [Alphaproteobacteria bacterium]